MDGVTLERDARTVLKQQTTRRWHQKWRAQGRTKQCIPDYDRVDWKTTLAVWHNNNPVYCFYSSQKDTKLRTYRTKKIHSMLPSMNALHVCRSDLYRDKRCRVCESEVEDNEHVWTCEASRQTREDIMKDAYAKIDKWGRATTAYNAEQRDKIQGQAISEIRTCTSEHPQKCARVVDQLTGWPKRMGTR